MATARLMRGSVGKRCESLSKWLSEGRQLERGQLKRGQLKRGQLKRGQLKRGQLKGRDSYLACV
eukprot:CAMPEP_0206054740 /NCGR_PEP_ID=MMETSP1466-20131121/38723_1 /ASSEMBLY_ACC=CAM_ASM_001126 /TAXON_ID=44452 /ORGANISM="Pavlova gyrans, Strain CCMP608" /LENGTH=63 /DNA_ID=CAMNT_0053429957 /DNA_START=88 /DNA_END=279 /DNA_ORIENTATION=-